jgi:hypothetical protein
MSSWLDQTITSCLGHMCRMVWIPVVAIRATEQLVDAGKVVGL